jgi:hypothetical protein
MMLGFQRQCGPLRPQFVFLDGYDAHFSTVLTDMRKDNIWAFFLRSNNSINDQPNDNGTNAMYERQYSVAMENVRLERPGIPLTPADVNGCLMKAWSHIKTYGGPTIVKSFGVTGICPLNTSVILPARELREELERHKRQKKDGIAPQDMVRQLDAENEEDGDGEDDDEARPDGEWNQRLRKDTF